MQLRKKAGRQEGGRKDGKGGKVFRQVGRLVGGQAGRRVGGWLGGKRHSQSVCQSGKSAGGWVAGGAVSQSVNQAGRQAGRQVQGLTSRLCAAVECGHPTG